MERSLMRSESNETSPCTHASFHPTFLRAYVVCSFVKNRTRSFAWKFNQTSLPDEIYLFLAIQLFLTCMCTCMCTRTLVVLERFNFVARHLWYTNAARDVVSLSGITASTMISRNFPASMLFLYFVIRCSLNSKLRIGCQVYRYLYERVVLATLRIRLTNAYTIFVK